MRARIRRLVGADDGVGEGALLVLELEDLLLDGVARDEAVGEDVRVWPMRCVRSIAWASTAGFHQGSRRKT